jgi:hypothetical protein
MGLLLFTGECLGVACGTGWALGQVIWKCALALKSIASSYPLAMLPGY